ncbi:MazG-like family protein [Streptomyces sp. NPDC048491]|uniref:MazG-like family protein n=1 Tax=Streptomyces sp. NPDC048491 TaxID=3157207 RepID=UPI0034363245
MTTNQRILAISAWIDAAPDNQHRDPEAQLFGRVAKVAEESGEAIAALIGALGHNARKGRHGTLDDVERELLDVALAALAAVAHLRAAAPHPVDVLDLLADHVEQVADRVGLT